MTPQEAVAVLRGVQEHQGLYIDVRTAIQVVCDEIERLRAQYVTPFNTFTQVVAERDAAHADLKTQAESWDKDIQTARAWRACAERLASWIDPLGPLGGCDALVEYERLKEGQP